MTIRKARFDDREPATRLWRLLQKTHEMLDKRYQTSDDAEDRWRQDFRDRLREHLALVLVAEDSDRLIGLLTAQIYHPAPIYKPATMIYVEDLVVEPESRRRGVGRALVDRAIEWGNELGATEVRAGVLAGNRGARVFWDQVGAGDYYVTVSGLTERA